jgi:activating signal cointegrator complex subunit 3
METRPYHAVSHSTEFENIAPREDEMPELETLQRDRRHACPFEIKATLGDKVGKVNLLLQARGLLRTSTSR